MNRKPPTSSRRPQGPRQSRTKAAYLIAAEREQQCLALRKAGYHYREIGSRLGIGHATAVEAVQRALKKLNVASLEEAEQLRRLESARLDDCEARIVEELRRARDPLVVSALIRTRVRISERRGRLWGFDKAMLPPAMLTMAQQVSVHIHTTDDLDTPTSAVPLSPTREAQ